ncbi:MAG: right-handed parallel beta-helix repeat-containing protein, partial [bacterium]|nr:right-handed parallel beta-helix repeat-containing protein [bacterium]
LSSPHVKNYFYWGRNTVKACNQWGAQSQGDKGGIAYQYFYQCKFLDTPVGVGPVWYPGDEGHGFRSNGNAHHLTFEECEFRNNGRLGIQLIGTGIDAFFFDRCRITGNKGAAILGPSDYTALEWNNCTVENNASDRLPETKPFDTRPPTASFDIVADEQGQAAGEARPIGLTTRVGQPIRFINTSRAADDSAELTAALWDFDEGPPLFQKLSPDAATSEPLEAQLVPTCATAHTEEAQLVPTCATAHTEEAQLVPTCATAHTEEAQLVPTCATAHTEEAQLVPTCA